MTNQDEAAKRKQESGGDSHHHGLPMVAATARGGHHSRGGCLWQPFPPDCWVFLCDCFVSAQFHLF